MPSPTAYWPFDGYNIDPKHMPRIESKVGPDSIYQPWLYPSQAYFLGNCVKSMYMGMRVYYESLSSTGGGTPSGSLHHMTNQIKRFTIQNTGSSSPIKFVAQPSGIAGYTTNFVLDFSQGRYQQTRVSNKKPYTWHPKATVDISSLSSSTSPFGGASDAKIIGSLPGGSTVTLAMNTGRRGLPTFREGISNLQLYLNAVGANSDIQISSISDQGSYLTVTERFDTIYFSGNATVGYGVSIICPPVISDLIPSEDEDNNTYRSGFADVTKIWIAGVANPLVVGSDASQQTFVVTSSKGTAATDVKDTISFAVPDGAVTGPVRFMSVANAGNAVNTTDYYSTAQSLVIV